MPKPLPLADWWIEAIELMLLEHCTFLRAASVLGKRLTEKEAGDIQRRRAWRDQFERQSREYYEAHGSTTAASKSRLVGEMLDDAKRLREARDYKAAADVVAQAAKLLGYASPETNVNIWAEIGGAELQKAIDDVRAKRLLPEGQQT